MLAAPEGRASPLDSHASDPRQAHEVDGLMQRTGRSAKPDRDVDKLDVDHVPVDAEPRVPGRPAGGLHANLDVTNSVSSHERHDRRCLALHVEAVQVLQAQPELAQRVLEVLDRWEAVADPHSKPLRDEWRRIVLERLWALAIETSERGNQLRQASPLGFVLDPSVRESVTRGFQHSK